MKGKEGGKGGGGGGGGGARSYRRVRGGEGGFQKGAIYSTHPPLPMTHTRNGHLQWDMYALGIGSCRVLSRVTVGEHQVENIRKQAQVQHAITDVTKRKHLTRGIAHFPCHKGSLSAERE